MLEQLAEGKVWLIGSMAFLGIYLMIVIRVLTGKRDYEALERMALEGDGDPDASPERSCAGGSPET
jgi:hypothetical protein